MIREFSCAECGRWIWRAIPLMEGELQLCALCVMIPGWIEDSEMRKIFDPENSVDPAKILGSLKETK